MARVARTIDMARIPSSPRRYDASSANPIANGNSPLPIDVDLLDLRRLVEPDLDRGSGWSENQVVSAAVRRDRNRIRWKAGPSSRDLGFLDDVVRGTRGSLAVG